MPNKAFGDQAGDSLLRGKVNDEATIRDGARLYTQPPQASTIRPLQVQQYAGPRVPPAVGPIPPQRPIPRGGVNGPPMRFIPSPWGDPAPNPFHRVQSLWGEGNPHPFLPPPSLWGDPGENLHIFRVQSQSVSARISSHTPANGVMTFRPEYAVTAVHRPPPRNAVSSANAVLTNRSIFARRAYENAAPKALMATAFVLPESKPANWDEWYKRIANAIYQVWVQQGVCPGSATIRTTVWDTQNAEGAVTDFTPAADVARNAQAESNYREAALKAVNSLDSSRACVFPTQHPRKVVFDIQLTRLVNGPAGCKVVRERKIDEAQSSQ